MQPSPASKHRTKSAMVRTLRAYLGQSQIPGYKIIVAPDRPLLERTCWTVISLVSIVLTAWMILYAYLNIIDTPTVTSQRPNRVSVLDLPFPAVAFCSENRISRKALTAYAEFVLNATTDSEVHIGRNVTEVSKNLLVLGKFYDLRMDDEDFYIFDRVHSALKVVYNGVYPITDILANLVPKCDKLLKRCKWLGRNVDCTTLFVERRTYAGNCCAFNYVRPVGTELRRQSQYNRTITLTSGVHVNKHGPGFGLVVLLDQQPHDYAFSLHSNMGVHIMVFDPANFPDQTSGAVKEKFIGMGEEMFLSVAPQPNNGLEEMRKYDRRTRNCVFADEISLIYNNFYTLSECLLVCRLDHIRRDCNCLLPQYLSYEQGIARCLLDDLPCLCRWGLKWYNSESLVSNSNISSRRSGLVIVELESKCPDCLPLCNMVKYDVESSTSNFVRDSFEGRLLDAEFTRDLHAQNHSIVYINFGSHKVPQFDQNNLSTWYDQLAYFGGLAGLTFGASIISVLEIIYFLTGKFGALYFRRQQPSDVITSRRNNLLLFPQPADHKKSTRFRTIKLN